MSQRPDIQEIVSECKADGDEKVWELIASGDVVSPEPDGNLRARDLFTYALVLCEADQNLERLTTLFNLARGMQDLDGNFRWQWEDTEVDDNAVEFCMRGAALLCLLHEARIRAQSPQAWARLQQIVNDAVEACRSHLVPEKHTNIALMNAMNLLLLGRALADTTTADEGRRRFDQFCIYTYEWGIHEYCSPTYTGIDLHCLGLIERFCNQQRQQAQALLTLFWTDVALNRLSSSGRVGGAHSRKLEGYLLEGIAEGVLGRAIRMEGWISLDVAEGMTAIYHVLVTWHPPDNLLYESDRFPRLVRQGWGRTNEDLRTESGDEWTTSERLWTSRTHFLCEGITLSSANAGYDWPSGQDLPLTVDFSLPESAGDLFSCLRCYFLPDANHDPYGRGDHLRPLLWVAAQRQCDALGLVLYHAYRPDISDSDYRSKLESHFVMSEDRFWIDEVRAGAWSGRFWGEGAYAGALPGGFLFLRPGNAVVLRQGGVAVGVRVIWTRTLKGMTAPVQLIYHPNVVNPIAMRLTVAHHFLSDDSDEGNPRTTAGAAFWVRIGDGLQDDQAFALWRKAFLRASFTGPEIDTEAVDGDGSTETRITGLRLGVEGLLGRLSVKAVWLDRDRFVTLIDPPPSQAVLQRDGLEIGRPLLRGVEPIRSYEAALNGTPLVSVPGRWEAEDGRVWSPMEVKSGSAASGGWYVWTPNRQQARVGREVGSVAWRLNVSRDGSYYIWGRVLTPSGRSDSFVVRIFKDPATPLYLANWMMGAHDPWEWAPMRLEVTDPQPAGRPTELRLPAGEVTVQLFAREAGARIDCLSIADDPNRAPA